MAEAPIFTSAQIDAFMDAALDQARAAGAEGEVPIGAVLVYENEIVARAHNHREQDQLATAHAELMVIEQANRALDTWRLEKTALFVTLEPCVMCAGAIVNARIPAVYYGADDAKGGATRSLYALLEDERLNHRAQVHPHVHEEQAAALLQDFFRDIRARRKAAKQIASVDPTSAL